MEGDVQRPIDPVVIPGSEAPGLLGTPNDRIHLYRWNGAAFSPLPFQIDEIGLVDLLGYLGLPQHCPVSGFDSSAAVCENNYLFDDQGNAAGNHTFDVLDELVFMARDAGLRAPVSAWINGNVADTRYEITIRNQHLSGGLLEDTAVAWVYAFVWQESHDPESSRNYVQWESQLEDPDRDEDCATGDFITLRGQKSCGWARGNLDPQTGQAVHATLDAHWIGHNTLNRLKIRPVNGEVSLDLVDRVKLRIGQQDGPRESEGAWDIAGCPRFHGIKKPPADYSPIRIVRVAQGNLSGATTTRVDWYYGTHLRTRYRLRVHSGAGPLFFYLDLLAATTPGALFTKLFPPGGSSADVINGQGADHSPAGQYDSPGPTVWNWNQVNTSPGSISTFIRETRPLIFTGSPVHYYDDSGAPTPQIPADVPEYEPERIGMNGTIWNGVSLDMQDRSCNNLLPDDPQKLWREVDFFVIPNDGGRNATTYRSWLEWPLQSAVAAQQRPVGGLPNPCRYLSVLGFSDPQNGFSADLLAAASPIGDCDQALVGFLLFRAEGLGNFRFLGRFSPGAVFTDASVRHGTAYRYRVYALNNRGESGPPSSPVTIHIQDIQSPEPPSAVDVAALPQGAHLCWAGSTSRDVVGYDILASGASGGPYTKINSVMLPLVAREWIVSGLEAGNTYYVVLQAVDWSGNRSENSLEVEVTPLP